MQVQFATTEKERAARYITKAVGKYADDAAFPSFLKDILGEVEQGYVRVGDPMMYGGNIPIYPTPKATPDDIRRISARYDKFIKGE